ncbi:MAG: GNAT family N-acetyltransferase [Chloroflexota bacterium]|nr:GNAT family N-acetyltransferase [Chloroflexota bacterium]
MIRELEVADVALAYRAMAELRKLETVDVFVSRVAAQRREGYRLAASFEDGDPDAAAVAGFRLENFLAWGKAIYVDDLSTRKQYRGRGHGGKLMDWLIAEARRLDCNQLHLDSGVGPDREDAHRLYMNKGLRISAHHFQIDLRKG